MALAQTTSTLFMVRPASFGSNPQTLVDNAYQATADPALAGSIREAGKQEFDAAVALIRSRGVEVLVCHDQPDEARYDAVFPNNWISTHHDGTVVLYPMKSAARRLERNLPLLEIMRERFEIARVIDLTDHEGSERYLEGTGSLVFDHIHRVVYAALSLRTHRSLARHLAETLSYRLETFETQQADYHTNVILAIGQHEAILSSDSIREPHEFSRVQALLMDTGREIITLSQSQVNQFAGNALQVGTDRPQWVFSRSGWESLDEEHQAKLSRSAPPIVVDVPTIQRYGGGSIRCMLGEVFLTPRMSENG